jgi:hypothetical protein
MILITSAAYVNTEFQTEFGRLPPAFLPVGNRRLFEHQIESLHKHFPGEALAISLPDSYQLAEKDARYLARHAVQTLRSDERLDLASAVATALAQLPPGAAPLRILHGDTLVTDLPHDPDVIGIVRTIEDYAWEVEQADHAAESVWCGYFCFADPGRFLALLQEGGHNFTAAVRAYSAQRARERRRLRCAADQRWLRAQDRHAAAQDPGRGRMVPQLAGVAARVHAATDRP